MSAGTSWKYFEILSSVESFPAASSFTMAAPVNCFVMDPMSKTVRGPFAIYRSASLYPKPFEMTGFPPTVTDTVPLYPAAPSFAR